MKVKKWLLGLVTFAAMVVICAVCAGAQTYGDFEYGVLSDGTVNITDYNGSAEKVVIPDTIDGKSVTSIGDRAFKDCTSLTSITIPNNVTNIGYSAFCGCSSLASITIPNSVTEIGGWAFCDCTSLKSITIPNSVTSIGESAFKDCTSLTSITIPDSITSIGGSAFRGCTSLTSIMIPDSVTEIGWYVFGGCTSLTAIDVEVGNNNYTSVNGVLFNKDKTELICYPIGKSDKSYTIPNSATSIGDRAFYWCTSLTSITIPNGVTEIGSEAFGDCTSLTSIMIPNSVTEIGDSAFSGCASIKSITIPNSVTEIGSSVFSGCRSLTSITIPNSVTSIGDYAFGDCTSLTNITIPNSVTEIGDSAFENCTSLTSITISNNVTNIGYRAFYGCTSLTSIMIPDSVTSIGSSAFKDCTSLTSITIPNSVTSIDYSAFSGCTSLKSITIPNSVTSISSSVFSGCTSLTSITIPNSVTSIGWGAFDSCTSLTSITIPDSVTIIGSDAFRGCTSLTSITIPDSVTEIYGGTFSGCTSLKSITISNSVTEIGDSVFENCTSLISITIPDSVTSIDNRAFEGCTSLTAINVATGNQNYVSVSGVLYNKDKTTIICYPAGKKDKNYKIPDGVTEIDWYAFLGCANLASITIPNSVTEIGGSAFRGCTSLTSIMIPDSVTEIGGYAFEGCSSLASITIPSGVTSISGFDFWGCTSLTAINVATGNQDYASANGVLYDKDKTAVICYPVGKKDKNYSILDSVTHIYSYAFRGCTNLTSITIPDSVTGIGEYAFYDCASLTSIMIPDSVTYIGDIALGYYYDNGYKKLDNFKIYCYSGTEGEKYAIDNGFAYELLDKSTIANVTGFKVKSLTSTNVTLQWTKNSAASGYEIEQYKSGKWVNVAKITGNATTSYTVKGLAAGTAGYKFRMRAVKDGAYSDYTSALTVNTNPYGVGGFKCSSKSSTSVTLKWNKGTTASGYQLQQYKDGKWVTIYTGTKATNTSFTVKNLKAGTAGYRFRIRAYKTYGNTKQYGSWSSEVKVNTNPYGVGGFKCSSKTSTSVTLKWNKGTTASGYQLQQYKNGKWVTIYTGTKATNTSYTVKNLKAGTAGYRFRIRAYKTYGNTKQYGSWSSEAKVNTNPYGVGGFKAKSTAKTSITLGWNKGTTASGYQLQQYKGGKWVTVYTGTKSTSTSCTIKSLKANTSYKFRIRAYKTYGNTKQYGSWSSTLTVKTKK